MGELEVLSHVASPSLCLSSPISALPNLDEKGAMKHPPKWNLANLPSSTSVDHAATPMQGLYKLDKSHMSNHAHRCSHAYVYREC